MRPTSFWLKPAGLVLMLMLVSCGQGQDQATVSPPLTAANGSPANPPQAVTPGSSPTGLTSSSTSGPDENGSGSPPRLPLPIGQALQTTAEIPLPGNSTRFDYQSLDAQSGRLFIAHLGDSSLIVFDLKTNKVLAEIGGLGGIHGVLVVPETGKIFATATSDHQLAIIDSTTLKIISRMAAGNYPDGMAYDPINHKLYISDEGGNSEPVIDTQTNKALASIPLDGEAGNTQYDPVSQHIFVAVQTRNDLAEIDPKTDNIVARYGLPGCQHGHGLQLDVEQRLAFVACQGNARLLTLDMQKGMRVISVQDIGANPDVLALDNQKHLLFVASESGVVSIFNESKPAIEKVAEGLIAPSAHTIALDIQTHRIYLPLENAGGKPLLRIMEYRSSS